MYIVYVYMQNAATLTSYRQPWPQLHVHVGALP